MIPRRSIVLFLLIIAAGWGNRVPAQTNSPSNPRAAWNSYQAQWGSASRAELEAAANRGDAGAQFFLGRSMIDRGVEGGQKTEAAEWVRRAAEQGLPEAQTYFGWLLDNGIGVPRNRVQAEEWTRKAADAGLAEAQFRMGTMAQSQRDQLVGQTIPGNYTVALEWFTKAADNGHAEAMHAVGELYFFGKLGHDIREAAKWYRRAAQQGHLESMMRLGEIHSRSGQEWRNEDEAVRWFKAAGEKGHTESQYQLGMLLMSPEQIAPDVNEAKRWFGEAAGRGHSLAAFRKALLEATQADGSVDASRLPVPVLFAAAEQGDSLALLHLGRAYEAGRTGPADAGQALRCYQLILNRGASDEAGAALERTIHLIATVQATPDKSFDVPALLRRITPESISAAARYELGTIFMTNTLGASDPATAVKWFTEAAKGGDAAALNQIGELWAGGFGGVPDTAEAARWYRRAGLQGHAVAQRNLARAYVKGSGVPADPVKAWAWFRLAADSGDAQSRTELRELEAALDPGQLSNAALEHKRLLGRIRDG